MFHKILSNEKYGIGNFLHVSIEKFNEEFKDYQKSIKLLPLPMKKAVYIIPNSDQLQKKLYPTYIKISILEDMKWNKLCHIAEFQLKNTFLKRYMKL